MATDDRQTQEKRGIKDNSQVWVELRLERVGGIDPPPCSLLSRALWLAPHPSAGTWARAWVHYGAALW